jgi:hypothetical protein
MVGHQVKLLRNLKPLFAIFGKINNLFYFILVDVNLELQVLRFILKHVNKNGKQSKLKNLNMKESLYLNHQRILMIW